MRSCLETVENARPLLVGKRRHPSTVVLAAFGPGVFRQQRQRQKGESVKALTMLATLAAVAFIVRLRAPSAENAIFTENKYNF